MEGGGQSDPDTMHCHSRPGNSTGNGGNVMNPLREPIYEQRHIDLPTDCYVCGDDLDPATWDEQEEDYEVEPGRFKTGVVLVNKCEGCGRDNRA